jgi:hypothetical protein
VKPYIPDTDSVAKYPKEKYMFCVWRVLVALQFASSDCTKFSHREGGRAIKGRAVNLCGFGRLSDSKL